MALASSVLVPFKINAQPALPVVNGNINFASGFLKFDTGNIGNAHSITSFSNVVVGTANGAYNGLSNAVVTWTPFSFNPPDAEVKPLWQISTNGVNYSFDATSIFLVFQNSGYVDLRGTGVAHVTGHADTPGTWTLAAQLTGSFFTFSATTMSTNGFFPNLTLVSQTNGVVTFSWNSLPGQPYQVEYASDLPATNWQSLGDVIFATDTTTVTNDTPSPAPRRYYRVVLKD